MRSIDTVRSFFNKFFVWQSSFYTFFGFIHKNYYYVIYTKKRAVHIPLVKLQKPMGLAAYLNRERDIFSEIQ
jgi:hypothetical protein